MSDVVDMLVDEEAMALMIAEDPFIMNLDAVDIVNTVKSDVVDIVNTAESDAVDIVKTVKSTAVDLVNTVESNVVDPVATAKSDGVVPLSDASPSITPTVPDLPVVTTNDTQSTSGIGSSRPSPRRSSRRKPSKVTRKRRTLDSYKEPEYAIALLSARKSC